VSEEYRFVGRTFAEYRWMFALEVQDVTRGSVLDCPGGPSSFAAIASSRGGSVTAVDPLYTRSVAALDARCGAAVERTVTQLAEDPELFVWDLYEDVETRGRYLRAAYERFLADYAHYPDRYVAAALPDLPFISDSFALVLSATLLFLYDDRLDRDFHAAAPRELARVASEEVRVFTLASLDRGRSSYVDPVAETLRGGGLAVEFEEVPYEFQPGATEMIVVSECSRVS
jgi:hypothetical protein